MSYFTADNLEMAHEIISRYPRKKSALIPLLHLAQEQEGWVTDDAMRQIAELTDTVVGATIALHKNMVKSFLPSSVKFVYNWNMRELSSVYQGLCLSERGTCNTATDFLRLWAHECLRVFHDRLTTVDDREYFIGMLGDKVKEFFQVDFKAKIMPPDTTLLYGNFIDPKIIENKVARRKTNRRSVHSSESYMHSTTSQTFGQPQGTLSTHRIQSQDTFFPIRPIGDLCNRFVVIQPNIFRSKCLQILDAFRCTDQIDTVDPHFLGKLNHTQTHRRIPRILDDKISFSQILQIMQKSPSGQRVQCRYCQLVEWNQRGKKKQILRLAFGIFSPNSRPFGHQDKFSLHFGIDSGPNLNDLSHAFPAGD